MDVENIIEPVNKDSTNFVITVGLYDSKSSSSIMSSTSNKTVPNLR